MLKNHSPETQLISSLLNNRAGNEAAGLGVTPDMFKAYRAEYEWLCKYIKTHRKTPSTQTFIEKFSDFPASEVVEFIDAVYVPVAVAVYIGNNF